MFRFCLGRRDIEESPYNSKKWTWNHRAPIIVQIILQNHIRSLEEVKLDKLFNAPILIPAIWTCWARI